MSILEAAQDCLSPLMLGLQSLAQLPPTPRELAQRRRVVLESRLLWRRHVSLGLVGARRRFGASRLLDVDRPLVGGAR